MEISNSISLYDYKSSKETYKITLNIFYKWCIRCKLREDNPIEEVPKSTGKKKIIEAMKQSDFRAIQQRCQSLREITLVTCLWYTGMRSKELRFIKIDDVNLSKGFINISHSKTTT